MSTIVQSSVGPQECTCELFMALSDFWTCPDILEPPVVNDEHRGQGADAGTLAPPRPDGVPLLVAQDKRVGTLHDFTGEDEIGFPLLDF